MFSRSGEGSYVRNEATGEKGADRRGQGDVRRGCGVLLRACGFQQAGPVTSWTRPDDALEMEGGVAAEGGSECGDDQAWSSKESRRRRLEGGTQ